MSEVSNQEYVFLMHAARSVMGTEAGSLSEQVEIIEQTIERIPNLTFDLTKGLIDSVCKTVLADLGETVDRKWDTPKLVKTTANSLRLVSPSITNAANAESSMKKLTGGLSTVVQGLCELRNHHGLSAHGQDAQTDRLNEQQAILAAQAADVIVSFLYRIHRDTLAQTPGQRAYHEDHPDFNKDFDEVHEAVTIGDVSFEASRVLCLLDNEAYRAALIDFNTRLQENSEEDDGVEAANE